MNGWQIQAMWERDTAALWEALNASDPYEDQMKKAAREIKGAIGNLAQAENYLLDAMNELKGSPMESVVASLLMEIEDRQSELRMLKTKYERGLRS